jgi:hypothetical protein
VGFRRNLCALALAAIVSPTASAIAAKGDCSQPSSTGSAPSASDCLYILKVAVGTLSCTPPCICAPKGTLPTTASDALLCLRHSVGQPAELKCPCVTAIGDDFNDNSKDPAKWGTDEINGNAVLTETSHVLQLTVGTGTADDFDTRPWIASFMPYTANWEVQIDLVNLSVPVANDQLASFGFSVYQETDHSNEVFGELYASHLDAPPARNGFYGEMYTNDQFIQFVDSNGIDGLTKGAIRITFNAATKVLTLYYSDLDPSVGYSWTLYGSFGVDGSDGVDANSDWGMTSSDRFSISVYGFGEQMTIAAGKVYGDNFLATGGVAP